MVRKKPIYYKSTHTTQKNFWGCTPGPGWPWHPPRHPWHRFNFPPVLNPRNMLQYLLYYNMLGHSDSLQSLHLL